MCMCTYMHLHAYTCLGNVHVICIHCMSPYMYMCVHSQDFHVSLSLSFSVSSLKGGSWASTGDEASRFARFSFRRHFFQHLGFRLARSPGNAPPPVRLCKAEVFVMGTGVTGTYVLYVSYTNFCLYRQVCITYI